MDTSWSPIVHRLSRMARLRVQGGALDAARNPRSPRAGPGPPTCWSALSRRRRCGLTGSATARRSSTTDFHISSMIPSTSAISAARCPTSCHGWESPLFALAVTACRSAGCRWTRSVESSTEAKRRAQPATGCGRPYHRFDRADLRSGRDRPGRPAPHQANGARPGDALVLGKPLGVGIYAPRCAKRRRPRLRGDALHHHANAPGRLWRIDGRMRSPMSRVRLGHLLEMCRASEIGAQIRFDRSLWRRADSAQDGFVTGASARTGQAQDEPDVDHTSTKRNAHCSPTLRHRVDCSWLAPPGRPAGSSMSSPSAVSAKRLSSASSRRARRA